jgi:hypothetical protein
MLKIFVNLKYASQKLVNRVLSKYLQYVKKMFETNKGNFSGSKPIIGRSITFNPEKLDLVGLEQFFYILYTTVKCFLTDALKYYKTSLHH